LAADILLYRVLRVVDLPWRNRPRRIRLHPDVELLYRLNRGDILALREVWIYEAYRLPFDVVPRTMIDLGAHIGLTSVWLARRYGCSSILAVEPFSENAQLLRTNIDVNQIDAEIVEAAVGPVDGVARFEAAKDSTSGRISAEGHDVRIVSMPTLIERLRAKSSTDFLNVDLVKLDIEGGEQALLEGDKSWLGRVRSIIVEFHPRWVDYGGLVRTLERAGFQYVPAESVHAGSMDGFVRADLQAEA
jgi:FkbM family methyltransferase